MHVSVLLHEVLALLDPKPGEFMIDGTLDGGGHATAILEKIGPKGKLLGVDLDESMIANAEEKFRNDRRVLLKAGNYAELPEIMAEMKLPKADGLLLDLGFSSTQLTAERGFSFQTSVEDEPLLMTYSKEAIPVRELVRQMKEADLADLIYRLSGERYSRRIAKAIKSARRPIVSVADLREAIVKAVPGGYERGRIHPATRTFQALRMYANGELENLARVLDVVPQVMAPKGRVAIITFHSLEDRMVKQAFRSLVKQEVAELLTPKPVEAARMEVIGNPRSRSAKLRVLQFV